MHFRSLAVALIAALVFKASPARALERPDVPFQVFQFPADQMPRIDGNPDDWDIVPARYVYGTDYLLDDSGGGARPDPASIDVKVRVGWVKGLNRLYFLYEASDNYWDFARPGLQNDTFEIVVDGDRSGGPLIARFHPQGGAATRPASSRPATAPVTPPPTISPTTSRTTSPAADPHVSQQHAWFSFQGNHAQNYHIFTPALDKDWCMAWGPQARWIKKLPYSNVAYNYNFKPGQPGKLVMECWVTPFDYAGGEGPSRAVESILTENRSIGLSWAVLDYDDVTSNRHTFWNLSPKRTMYGQASELCAFKLMPLEPPFQKTIEARWDFTILDIDRRIVAFDDRSIGKNLSWKWDFGDGTTSTEQHPVHTYAKTGNFVVVLEVKGPDGVSRRSKVWDVTFE